MTLEIFRMVLNVCPVLLRPVIRILLSAGVNYRQFSTIARRIYVEVGLEDFNANGKPQNISRTSIITGISRSEVRKLKADSAMLIDSDVDEEIEKQLFGGSKILQSWHRLPSYQDNDGKPLVISLFKDEEPSFKHLMTMYGGDIKPGSMLNELLKSESVERVGKEQIKVLKNYYMPLPGNAEHIVRAAHVIAEFSQTVHHNMTREKNEPSLFEGRAYNPSIPDEYVVEFHDFMEKNGMDLLKKIDTWLTERELTDTHTSENITRLGAGIYITENQNKTINEETANV